VFLRTVLALLLVSCLGVADTLTLHSGKVIEGSYLGGDSRRIRMAVGDRIETFDVGQVASITFGSVTALAPAPQAAAPAPQAAAPAPAPPPAPAAPVRERERILRPERPAAATSAPRETALIPEGTQIVIRMIDDVDSTRDRIGQTFRASLDEPILVNGVEIVGRGADVLTKLVDDKESGKLTGRTELTMDVVSITVNGKTVDIATSETTMASESRTGQTAKVVGGTAALGAVIGAIAGGGRGAAIGAASGAGLGGAVQVLTKGQRVRIPAETRLSFTLQQAVKL